jgi:hypothetical protein
VSIYKPPIAYFLITPTFSKRRSWTAALQSALLAFYLDPLFFDGIDQHNAVRGKAIPK